VITNSGFRIPVLKKYSKDLTGPTYFGSFGYQTEEFLNKMRQSRRIELTSKLIANVDSNNRLVPGANPGSLLKDETNQRADGKGFEVFTIYNSNLS